MIYLFIDRPNFSSLQVCEQLRTIFDAICDQLRTSFEPDSVMEFGLYSEYKSSAVVEMGDCATAKWAEKWGQGLLSPFQWGMGPHRTQCCLGRGLPPYQMAP